MEKRCGHCKETKDTASFGRNKATADGLNVWCMSCFRSWDKSPERLKYKREWHRKYYDTPHGLEVRRAATKRNIVSGSAAKARLRQRVLYPERTACRKAVAYVVKRGYWPHATELPCHTCARWADEWHHHRSYSKEHRYEAIPLCRACHGALKRKS